MNFTEWLKSKGFDPDAALGESQRTFLQAVWRQEQNPQPDPVPRPAGGDPDPKPAVAADATFDAKMRAIEEENDRIQYIRESTFRAAEAHRGNPEKVKQLRELCDAAVADPKTTKKDFQLALLRQERPNGPTFHFPQQAQEASAEVLEAAVCRAGGLKSLEKEYDDRTLSAVDKRFKGGVGLQELVFEAAERNGWRGRRNVSALPSAMRSAFAPGDDGAGYGPRAEITPSTISVSGILSNVANKFIRDSWMFVEDTWRRISAVRSVRDFKQITSYSLTGDVTYREVAPGGELKHGTLGNETYNNQAKTYGIVLGIDRRDMINDDLGAFTQIGRRLGRGGALKLNQVFWTTFLANSAFFTSGRGNYDDGADTAFGLAGLTAADVIWRAMTDPDGNPLATRGAILLVPSGHRIAATRLMNSPSLGNDDEAGEANPFAGAYRVESSVYLSNSAYTGYSALAWYILADPNDLPVIEVAFLNGQEMPTVETVEMAADHLGMAMRAYHDWGIALQEYRGGLKLKGEA